MKRDMDLVRLILIKMESNEHGFYQGALEIDGFTEESITYHVHLLNEAGLLIAADTTSQESRSPSATPVQLTWTGHEFVENCKNPKVWKQSKDVISKLGSASLAIWSEVLKRIVLENLGL